MTHDEIIGLMCVGTVCVIAILLCAALFFGYIKD